MTNSDFIAESHWDKWLTRRQRIREFDPDELVDRLCAARRVRHVLDETGLSDKDANNILRKIKYPIPFLKSHFPLYESSIKANRARFHEYLERTEVLRDALAIAIDELNGSFDRFELWGV